MLHIHKSLRKLIRPRHRNNLTIDSSNFFSALLQSTNQNSKIFHSSHFSTENNANNNPHGLQTMRLNKLMSRRDICSRREADTLIATGKVSVNDVVVTQMGLQVREDVNITIDGIKAKELINGITIMINKPIGIVSSQAEHGNIPALSLLTLKNRSSQCISELPAELNVRKNTNKPVTVSTKKGLASVGRLDLDSSGLLLFSNDGILAKKVIGSTDIEKEYLVTVSPQAPHVSHNKSIVRDSKDDGSGNHKRWRKDGTYETIERWRTMVDDRSHLEFALSATNQINEDFSMSMARKLLTSNILKLDGKHLRKVVVENITNDVDEKSSTAGIKRKGYA